MQKPRISVILPTFNRAHCLKRAVHSVLAQSFDDWELILIDDGSDDETPALRQRFAQVLGRRYRDYVCDRLGPSGARNIGIGEAAGEIVAFLDSDDFWFPEKLGVQLFRFDEEGSAQCSFTDFCLFDDSGSVVAQNHFIPRTVEDAPYPSLLEIRNNVVMTPTVIVRRSALNLCGNFDEGMRVCEDLDLWVRICRRMGGRFPAVRSPLTAVHIRTNSAFPYQSSLAGRAALYTKAVELDPGLSANFLYELYRELLGTYHRLALARNDWAVGDILARQLEHLESCKCPVAAASLSKLTMNTVSLLGCCASKSL